METTLSYYKDRLEKNKISTFLFFFYPPKHPYIFKWTTFLIFIKLELLFNLYFIPSIIAIYIIWEYQIILDRIEKILEDCIIEEICMEEDLKNNQSIRSNFPNDPLYVTNNDREYIYENRVSDERNLNFLSKIKNHYTSLISIVILYSILYLIFRFII